MSPLWSSSRKSLPKHYGQKIIILQNLLVIYKWSSRQICTIKKRKYWRAGSFLATEHDLKVLWGNEDSNEFLPKRTLKNNIYEIAVRLAIELYADQKGEDQQELSESRQEGIPNPDGNLWRNAIEWYLQKQRGKQRRIGLPIHEVFSWLDNITFREEEFQVKSQTARPKKSVFIREIKCI